MMLCHH